MNDASIQRLSLTKTLPHTTDVIAVDDTTGVTKYAKDANPWGDGVDSSMQYARFVWIEAVNGDVVVTRGTVVDAPHKPNPCCETVLSGTSRWFQLPGGTKAQTGVSILSLSGSVNVRLVWGL